MAKWTEEQLRAIHEENANMIISAGAGSGKTAVLSERVLRKINDGIHIHELLILTFTKAAAEEMKERIRKKLIESGNKEEADKVDVSYITTFDSYALSIVKKYHYYFNISKDIQIVDNSLIMLKKEELLDQIFETYYQEKNPKFLKLIDDFCLKDDTEIKSSILDMNQKLDLKYDKQIYLENYGKEYDKNIDKYLKEYDQFLLDKIEKLSCNIKELESMIDVSYSTKLQEIVEPLLKAGNYSQIKEHLNLKLPPLPRGTDEEVKKLKENISQTIKELKKYTKYQNQQEIKEDLIAVKEYAEIICEIIVKFTQKLNEYKYSCNQFEFIDISKMAIELLDKQPEIREELKSTYQEILLDEYQDTNDLQEKFISMISNNNVYMVGDIKQSIYRFRNANPQIFKQKYDCYSKNQGGIKIDLNKNFRSRKEVLDNINLIFDYVMDDQVGSANYRKDHRMIYGNHLYDNDHIKNQDHNLEILKYNYDKDVKYSKAEIEIFMIANDIKKKIESNYQIFDKDNEITRPVEYNDFVILMDRATNFTLYKKIFEYLEIPLTIYRDESITNKNEMSIIKNIIQLILKQKNKMIDEEYKYAYVSIARSYLFRFPDEQIFKTIQEENYNDSIIIQKVKKIIALIEEYSLKQIIESIIDEFEFYEKLITVGDIESSIIGLEYLLGLSSNLGNQGYDIEKFFHYLNEVNKKNYKINYSLDKNIGNSVKIMTIHGSKGLEFPICYYSGLYASFNTSEIKERFHFDNQYGMILPVFHDGIDHTIILPLLKEKYLREEISEKIRLFYVSLTRAKEKMIFVLPNVDVTSKIENIVPDSIRLKYNSFLDILNSVQEKLNPFTKLIDLNTFNITKDYNLIKKINYKEKIDSTSQNLDVTEINVNFNKKKSQKFSKEALNIYTKKEYENIRLGKEFHKKLEYQPIKENKIIHHFLESPIKIYREYEFMIESKKTIYHGVIDLMLEYEDEIRIIDYKLNNIQDEAYIKQLKGYQKYIENITSKKTEIYLYSIVTDQLQKVEEIGMK